MCAEEAYVVLVTSKVRTNNNSQCFHRDPCHCVQSYSPYSKCPAGAAIITSDGDVYSGPYVESAAYNPSIPPLQTAIIDAVIDGMPCYTEVSAPW